MHIALTADPELPVPPRLYGGIERVIAQLIANYQEQGHNVTLFAHQNSNINCNLIRYPGTDNSLRSLIANSYVISKTIFKNNFDIIHSFGRLAYLTPILPLSVPKLMSYQREPTIKQVKKASYLAGKNSLFFTGCSNYITKKIQPFASATTVYNSVSPEIYQSITQVKDDAPLVFLGRIEQIKGTHTAVQIAIKTNKKLIIAGNVAAEHQSYFDRKIKPFLNTQVSYIGPVNDLQKNKLLQNSLALLMPIEWDEPFGIVMIEAMACGTPVIAFKRGAVPEVVDDGKTGFYGDTTDELVNAVERVHLLNRETIRATVLKRFSAKVIADNYLTLYRKIIDKRSIEL